MRAPSVHRYTWKQYLALERESTVKHEFLEGEIYAMAGSSPEHALLTANVIASLNRQLEGRPCRVFTSDLRVHIQASGLAAYPDATVVCGELRRDPDDKNMVTNPTVIVEVLSESTEGFDRGEKFERYRQCPSLKEYVLVSQRERLIEVFQRGPGVDWPRTEARTGSIRIESIGCELAVGAVYAGVELG